MNYDQARQIDPTADRYDAGKWRYTSMNNHVIHPIGYCADIEECPAHCHMGLTRTNTAFEPSDCPTCTGKGYINRMDPCRGHDTAEEAERHYYEWEADHLHEMGFREQPNVIDGRHLCEALVDSALRPSIGAREIGLIQCGYPTLRGLGVEGDMMNPASLCDEHCNREGWMSARPFKPGRYEIHS